jgi:hypothetical protein
VLVDGVLERSIITLAVRLGVQVLHGGNDTKETRAGAPGYRSDVSVESNKKCGSERTRGRPRDLIRSNRIELYDSSEKIVEELGFQR